MAKRTAATALSSGTDPRAILKNQKKAKGKGTKPATWRVGDEVIGRVNEKAEANNVEKSSLVRLLLTYALDAMDKGDLSIDDYVASGPRKLDV